MSNDNSRVNGEPPIDPAGLMRAQLTLGLRDVERRFMGAHITLIVSAPGAAAGSPQFSYASTAEDDDLRAVLTSFMIERGWHR